MVGATGIEPVTFPVSGGRSPAELIARRPWLRSPEGNAGGASIVCGRWLQAFAGILSHGPVAFGANRAFAR